MEQKEALFDNAAQSYDDQFTHSEIGKYQRQRVYYWIDKLGLIDEVQSVFEINCGTGVDAQLLKDENIHVTATDGSPEMIAYAKSKQSKDIDFFVLDFKDLDDNWINSDLLFSNFGGLNCLDQQGLKNVVNTSAKHQNKGAYLVWVMMPKFCMMESLYLLTKFRFKSLFRRNTKKGVLVDVEGTAVKTFYHSPREVKKMLATEYSILEIKPVAFFLPPSYLEPFFQKRRKTLKFLNHLERYFGRFSLLSSYADHYIIIAVKK
ncbi:methyltransferase domain-containing protein [Crocinitomix catalasitica]|uniref:methyltransferase domain-containing protein n=1 Tax=Crocinitomix catalasitica TaxID=184607 RepID=UPI000481DD04|nr:methyltransferase domain-containing protein [Crocinitomix catalasitica]